ncbi:hotdog fold thioesterase [Pseudoteredinibacter isoporae]|uniref:hotdog fold thioesterase n=1 Tax=Pseudoteredinibacter isoporae TaxID=570281 RepID=UPI003103B0BD
MTERIWFSEPSLEEFTKGHKNTAVEAMGIEITEIGDDYIRGTMPADHRTFQPFGLIHGGANVVLAETLGSIGANLVIDPSKEFSVGQEVNANHVRGVREGHVIGTATLAYRGRSSQVWEIHIEDDKGRLSCISRLTMAVVPLKR